MNNIEIKIQKIAEIFDSEIKDSEIGDFRKSLIFCKKIFDFLPKNLKIFVFL
jgi:hypothetical protein